MHQPNSSELLIGTGRFACGFTDGPASRLEMKSHNERISIFVHDRVPESLSSTIPIRLEPINGPSAMLTSCTGLLGKSCREAIDGEMTISRNLENSVTGTLHFTFNGSDWRSSSFQFKIVPPALNTVCG